jgi:urease accessory protein
MLALLQLCDSLFPIGGFAYSDGLEAAACGDRDHGSRPSEAESLELLRGWLAASLDETIGRLEGPAVFHAWHACTAADWRALIDLDEQLVALRPSASMRRSTRTMGLRLLTTWQDLYPDPSVARMLALVHQGAIGPTLPVAFAGACVAVHVDSRRAIESYAYTRLAATISAAMRLMPIGQAAAHHALARILDRVPAVVDDAIRRDGALTSFTPGMDIAAMTQQYLHSRLFRS